MRVYVWITLMSLLFSFNCHALSSREDGKKKKTDNLNNGIKLLETTGFTSEVSNCDEYLGNLARQQDGYPEALKLFNYALKHANSIEDGHTLSSIEINIAEVYLTMDNYMKAKSYLDSALIHARKMNSVNALKKFHYDLFRFNQGQNALAPALNEFIRYSDLKDSIYNKQKSIQLAEIEIIHDIEQERQVIKQQQANILLLKKDNQIQRHEKGILSGVILFTLLIASLVLFIVRKRFIKLKADNHLKVKQQQIELEFKRRELASYALHLAQENQLLEDLQKDIDNLRSKISDERCYIEIKNKMNFRIQIDKDWEVFRRHFEEVHPSFFADLKAKFPNLSNNDLRLLALLKMSLSTKEIALLLNITPESVKKSRYRLRRKMDLNEEANIGKFITKIAG